MVTAIKQLVRVEAGGRVAVQSSDLREGESAEVIVMVNRADPVPTQDRVDALDRLRKNINLTTARAEEWESDARAERAARRDPAAQ